MLVGLKERQTLRRPKTRITIMRRSLPSTRFRRLGALAALAALVAAACFGLQAHAEPSQPTQSHATASK